MKAWKVLRPDRTSASATGKYRLNYPVGQPVTPTDGTQWLLAFLDRESAVGFAEALEYGTMIVPVEVERFDGDTQIRISRSPVEYFIELYWGGQFPNDVLLVYPPGQSVFCKSITCLE